MACLNRGAIHRARAAPLARRLAHERGLRLPRDRERDDGVHPSRSGADARVDERARRPSRHEARAEAVVREDPLLDGAAGEGISGPEHRRGHQLQLPPALRRHAPRRDASHRAALRARRSGSDVRQHRLRVHARLPQDGDGETRGRVAPGDRVLGQLRRRRPAVSPGLHRAARPRSPAHRRGREVARQEDGRPAPLLERMGVGLLAE